MATADEIRAAALVTGRRLKRKNAFSALLCGALPGLVLGFAAHTPASRWLLGIAIGLIWANGFEYVYHRFLLHWPKSFFGRGHLLHHLSTGEADEAEHVTFGSSPFWVVILFATNGAIAVAADWLLSLHVAPGVLAGFTLYMILVEEIHWRIHLGGWLPLWLGGARQYHMAHHDIPDGRYNVFFPIFDFLLGNMRPPVQETQAAEMARRASGLDCDPRWAEALEVLCVWVWVTGLAIGARFFWNSMPKA